MTVLVVGATGAQGGAVVRALTRAAQPVRSLVRDPSGGPGLRLAQMGVDVVGGDLDNAASLLGAMQGVEAVFSVLLADYPGRTREVGQAARLIDAALACGVPQVVHASVSATGWRGRDAPADPYWDAKEAVEAAMAAAGFASLTILKPAFMMENFIAPKAGRMFPDLATGEIVTAVAADTPVALVAADDVGAAAAAAFVEPDRFAGARIELAGDLLTLPRIAQTLAEATGRRLAAQTMAPHDVIARGQSPGWVASQTWLNTDGYPARPADMAAWGLKPTTLSAWAMAHLPALHDSLGAREDR